DAAQPVRSPLILDQPQAVFPCTVAAVRRPAVDHDGKLRRCRQFHLPGKYLLLSFPRRMIVVVIQPDLTPCDHLGMPCQSLHLGIRMVGGQSRFVGMYAERRVQERVLVCKLNSGIELGRTIAIANGDHRSHSGLASASDDLLAIRVELLAVEMSVRIYKHIGWSLVVGRSTERKAAEFV